MNRNTAIIFTYENNERRILGTLTANTEILANASKETLPIKEPSKYDNLFIVIDGLEYRIL